MNTLARRNENRGLDPWRNFFDMDFLGSRFPTTRNLMPAVNLSENDNSYCVDLVAPGYKKEDFKLKVNDDVLTISAETKNERTEGDDGRGNDRREYSRREYTSSSFTRSFRLPDNAKDDAIAAKYHDGILEINIPKTEKDVKASKEINIE
jgi:HSP20 family protein